jgi:hypothetical protein
MTTLTTISTPSERDPVRYAGYDSDGPNRPFGGGCDLGSWESGAGIFADGFESGDSSAWASP